MGSLGAVPVPLHDHWTTQCYAPQAIHGIDQPYLDARVGATHSAVFPIGLWVDDLTPADPAVFGESVGYEQASTGKNGPEAREQIS